jgi:predicted nucleic acid-binding protein
MRIVIDASVALKWVLSEPGSDVAIALRQEELIAPVLWLAEAANALWRAARVGQLTANEANDRFAELENAPIISLAMEPYLGRALRVATEINHPIYDCIYLALALHHETHVITADRRFAAIANRPGMSGRVRLLLGG